VDFQIIIKISLIIFSVTCFTVSWLFFDSLRLRFEIKTFLKLLGFLLLGIGFGSELVKSSIVEIIPLLIWLRMLGLYFLLAAFALDPHSKLQIGMIFGIIALIFTRDHLSLMILSLLISLLVTHLSYLTKHKDLIPFGTGFVLISIAEFFRSIEKIDTGQFNLASAFMYLFASVALMLWLWSYLTIRFNLPAGRHGLKQSRT